ncbi:MAG: polysaccharide deacetylase [Clostridium sp.]|nr:polysaccharide deacetylase [Clostridium sp.]
MKKYGFKNKIIAKRSVILFTGLSLIAILTGIIILSNKMEMNNRDRKRIVDMQKKKHNRPKKVQIANKTSVKIVPGEVVPWKNKRTDGKKIAYLTFDDGPSINTTAILQILDRNNIKANFFLIGKNAEEYPQFVKKEASDGEIIGNHTYSHQLNYKEGPENFVNDVDKCDNILKSILGDKYDSKLVRFPGGSFDPKNHPGKLAPFRDAITKAGYRYIDWNDETNDSNSGDPSPAYLLGELKKNTAGWDTVVVLMHDAGAKKNTVIALQQVIDYLKSQNFSFDVIR